jgi:hypothetical protein
MFNTVSLRSRKLTSLSRKVSVESWCARGVGSDAWIERLSVTRHDDPKYLNSFDLIIMETSINDIEHKKTDSGNRGQVIQSTEVLIRILRSLESKPALLWLGASLRSMWRVDFEARENSTADAVWRHRAVTVPYNIPQLSVPDSFLPLNTPEKEQWFFKMFRIDNPHPTRWGHKLIAYFTMRFIEVHLCMLLNRVSVSMPRHLPSSRLSSNAAYNHTSQHLPRPQALALPPPIYISDDVAKQYEKPFSCIHMGPSGRERRFLDRFLVKKMVHGFKVYEDVPGKPGLISDTTMSNFTIVIPTSNVRSVLRLGIAKVTYLISYENMGVFNLSVTSVSTGPLGKEMKNTTSVLVDTLWSERASIAKTVDLKFPISSQDKQLTVAVTVAVVEATPKRAVNKVKILSVMLS